MENHKQFFDLNLPARDLPNDVKIENLHDFLNFSMFLIKI